jgi:uncharacterized membrane protein YqjE
VGENETAQAGGVFASLRRIGDLALESAQNRLELVVLELQQEKERLFRLFLLAAVVVFLGNMAVLMATLTIIFLAGEQLRGPCLLVLTALYITGTAIGYYTLRKQLRSGPRPLDGTLSELEKDREWLRTRN